MKQYPPKINRILFGIILMLTAISLISFSIENKRKLKTSINKKNEISVNFHVMKITQPKLKALCEPSSSLASIKTFFIQFSAIKNTGDADVEYILKPYIFKPGNNPTHDQNLIEEFNPIITTPLYTPFTLPNLELRKQELTVFYNQIKNTSYTYVKLVPYVVNGNVQIEATAMNGNDEPIEITISKEKPILRARAYFNPCPPDRPQ